MILGLSFSHNATACVVDPADGAIVFCCSEERFTRRKNEWGIPSEVLKHIFEELLSPKEISAVAVGESCKMAYGSKEFATLINLSDYSRRDAYVSSKGSFLRLMSKETILRTLGRRVQLRELIEAKLKEMGVAAPIHFTAHHTAHAASAYYGSPFEEALVFTLDGEGDLLSGTCWRGSGAELRSIATLSERESIGLFYKSITSLLGFKVNQQEGQVLGLSAHGNPQRFRAALSQVLRSEHGEGRLSVLSKAAEYNIDLFSRRHLNLLRLFAVLPLLFRAQDWRGLLNAILHQEHRRFYHDMVAQDLDIDPQTAADIAAGAQSVFEEVVLELFQSYHKEVPLPQVAVAGGVFTNIQLNQRIVELPGVENLHVHPGMGDEGLALGAALLQAHRERKTKAAKSVLGNAFLGPDLDDADIEAVLKDFGAKWEVCSQEELAHRTALALAEGLIVGLIQGRLEYGPRALGHRSILADPRDRRVCDVLNTGLGRSPMMPFAPVMLDACYEELLESDKTPGALLAARFMTVTLNVRPEWREKIAAVVHADGTTRPQVVSREEDPFLHAILSRFLQLTGVGCLLNTSYNRHDEPIVNTAAQALSVLKDGPIDHLAIGSYWVSVSHTRIPQDASLRSSVC